jgi:hypothetical protein
MRAIKDFAHIGEGETSEDGLFTMNEVECLGACVNAPMIQVNNEYFYEDLNYENTTQLLKDWTAGKEPKFGPQIDRQWSLGQEGRTALHEIPHDPKNRDWAGEKARWDAAIAAKATAAAVKK